MPSSPRKRGKAKTREAQKLVDGNDSDDSYNDMPPLVNSDSDDDTRDDWPRRLKANNNMESVDMWLDLSKPTRERHVRVMKIYLLSPFLFDSVEQDDKWINWANECKLLSNTRNLEPSDQVEECLEAVDIVEEAFNKAITYMLAKEDSEEIEKTLGMMDKINTIDKLDNAILCAESFTTYLKVRERIKTANLKRKGDSKRKADTSLLLVFQQIYDHIKKLTQENKDLTKQFDNMCRQGEQQSTDLRKKGNNHFLEGKYKAAISAYSKAIIMSQYNHILYGNRAQSFLRTGEVWLALADGRRSVILNPEWAKGQYRYAQAFFDLGDIERAISANREARQSCKNNSKDLDSQYEKFLRERDVKAKKNAKSMKFKDPQLKMPNELDDLPDLVEADSSDTSVDSADDDDDYGMIDDNDSDDDTDNSNSDDEQSVPELVTDSSKDSDSDDDYDQKRKLRDEKLKHQGLSKSQANHASPKDLKKKKRKDQKAKQDQGKRKETENGICEGSQKRKDLSATLKQGSKAYLDGKWHASIRFYEQALQMLSLDDALQVFKLKRIDFILILYSHGTACLETKVHKELMEATKRFETIIIQYHEIKFPLAYYGLGRVFQLQNRFNDALEPLNKGLDMVKTGGEFGEYRWPGTQSIIQESEPEKLELAFKTIIALCQHPPRPDAICRFIDCQGRSAIYLTDPDYKGYVRLICDESCKIEYHPTCWKKYRSTYSEKNGDKDFLEEECLTPDCQAPLVQIQIYGDQGLKTEFVADTSGKQKQLKQGKVKTHGNQKCPKSEKKKKEEHKTEQQQAQEVEDSESKKFEETPSSKNHRTSITKADEPEEPEVAKPEKVKPSPEVKVHPDTRDAKKGDPGVYILRKNEEKLPDDLLAFKGAKSKSKKKKVKQNVQSLDEFLKDHGGEVKFKPPFGAAEEEEEKPTMPTQIPPSQWSEHELVPPFAVPAHLKSDVQAFERQFHAGIDSGYQQPTLTDLTPSMEENCEDPVEDYIVSLVSETLNAHGPMDVADARIIEPISFLPDSHQQKINECGGIKHFLMKSEQFVVQGNTVMLPDDLHFQEMVNKFNQYDKGGQFDFNKDNSKTTDFHFPSFNDSPPGFAAHNEHIPCPPAPPPLRIPTIEPIAPSSKQTITSKSNPENGHVKTLEETMAKPILVESNESKCNTFNGEETVNNEQQKFAESTETVGIPSSISNLIADVKLDKTVSNGSLIKQQEKSPKNEPCENDAGEFSAQHVSEEKLKGELKEFHEKFKLATGEANYVVTKNGHNFDSTPLLNTPPKHTRAGSSGSDSTICVKSKGIQTQMQVKAKGINTDTLPEPYKLEYTKASQERDELQRKLQDANEKLNNFQKRHEQELEKIKKKFVDIQSEKEKLYKDLQSAKQEGKNELQKLDKMCEEKQKLASSLEQRFKVEQDRYHSTIAGLRTELEAKEAELQTEKSKLNSTISQKDEALRKAVVANKQQESRAQDAEVKLLELRRDVGLKFLERSIQEATYTANNLINVRKASVGSSQKMDDLIGSWKMYFHDCQQKATKCRETFNAQIQEVGGGRVLSSLPQLAIPGPASYPGQPILQLNAPLVSHIQSSFQLTPADRTIPSQVYPHAAVAIQQPRPIVPNSVPVAAAVPPQAAVPPPRIPLPQKTPVPPTSTPPMIPHQAQQSLVAEGGAVAAAAKPDADSKGRSTSFERIMLRLSTAYPYLARADLTSLISEVRKSRPDGKLTGLALEEIVQCVDLLVKAKVKDGLIRLPPNQQASANVRSNSSQPISNPQPTPPVVSNGAVSVPPAQMTSTDLSSSQSSLTFSEDDDPCVICHDDMKSPLDTVTLECGHKYHEKCIRKWLLGEQSTCPTCRVHALLPDEFPRLK
ncbi:E3 ubiquitin-protein ligase TTC3 [Exaiptasia diaphana]|uniref:RING-type E3 ubiquitin transferase n=1 Tax=Exaiptasia diaphana TaxID=2652724 RepID=A0A913XL39_EXADI|nr:E3 ubiquitin-protein ligase TTC3 [Exaiptasia diaphana]KXJ25685.1 E3 ubiquitin-protein ligase TTC3 [Exaiptasia diaphana]